MAETLQELDERLKRLVAGSAEVESLAKICRDAPTKPNLIAHAVAVWRQGCTMGPAGECEECNAGLLDAIGKHLRGETISLASPTTSETGDA